jgi:hypothetical protein
VGGLGFGKDSGQGKKPGFGRDGFGRVSSHDFFMSGRMVRILLFRVWDLNGSDQ